MAATAATNPARPVLAPLVLGVALIALWSMLAVGLGPGLLPGPAALGYRLVVELGAGDLLRAAASTIGVSILGCLLGLAVALPLGYLLASSPTAAAALGPYLAASQAIPAVAVAPLLALWFGYGPFPKALLCALLVFFPILLNTVLGLTTLDPDIVDAARLDGAGRLRLLVSVQAPLALPAVLTGVRNGFVLSVTGAVVGEFVMGGDGLGELLAVFRTAGDTTGMFATLVVLAILAIAINMAVRGLERMVRWW